MSTEVGDAYIEVEARTDQFVRDLQRLKIAAKKIGDDIGDALSDTWAAKVGQRVAQVRQHFRSLGSSASSAFRQLRTDADVFVKITLTRLRWGVRDALDNVKGSFQAMSLVSRSVMQALGREVKLTAQAIYAKSPLIQKFADRIKEDLALASYLGGGAVAILKDKIDRSFSRASLKVPESNLSRFAREVGATLRSGLSLAAASAKFNALRIRDAVGDALNGVPRRIATAMNSVRSSIVSRLTTTFPIVSAIANKMSDALSGMVGPKTRTAVKVGAAFIERTMKKMANSVRNSWLRMDSTVRAVTLSILVAGAPLATVFSGLSAGLVGMVAAAAGAVAALSSLAAIVPLLGLGIGLAVAGLKDLSTYSPQAQASIDALKKSFTDSAVPAFMNAWKTSLTEFLGVLAGVDLTGLATSIGGAFSKITEGFTGLLQSPAFSGFMTALQGDFSTALGNIGSALAPVIEAFMSFFTAAAPYAVILSEMFLQWANNLAAVWSGMSGSAAFTDFMDQAIQSVELLFGILGTMKDILSTVFQAGIGPGNQLLTMIQGLLTQLDVFFKSPEGQAALQNFFDKILIVLPPLFNLIGAVGQALASLITPAIVASIGSFLNALASVMPVLSQIIAVLANAQIVEVFAAAIGAIGKVLEPLAGPLSDFVSTIADSLMKGLEEVQPFLGDFGDLLGQLLEAVTPLIPVILELVFGALKVLTPVLEALKPILDVLIQFITEMSGSFLELMPVIVDLLKIALLPVTLAMKVMSPIIGIVAEVLSFLIGIVVKAIATFADWVKNNKTIQDAIAATSAKIDTFIGWLTTAKNAVSDFINNAASWFRDLPGKISSAWSGLSDTISAPFKSAFNGIKNAWNNTVGKLSWTVPDWVPIIGGKKFSAPKFAAGTIAKSPTMGIFGEAGPEAVVPLDRPLSQVNPDVRWLSAIAQGKAPAPSVTSGGVTIAEGAITVIAPETNPALVAAGVLDRIVASAK